jgi:hypothetical protein
MTQARHGKAPGREADGSPCPMPTMKARPLETRKVRAAGARP